MQSVSYRRKSPMVKGVVHLLKLTLYIIYVLFLIMYVSQRDNAENDIIEFVIWN